MKQAVSKFLAKGRIAVTGVSRTPRGHGANVVYQRLRDRGYEVFAINPKAEQVEGDRCYPDLKSIPGGCPCMFDPTADLGHKVMRLLFARAVPKRV